MSSIRQYLIALILVSAAKSWAADQDFYRTFLSMVDTNSMRNVAIKSPILIDTNNNTFKLTNSVVNLVDAKANGQLGDIRLRMTMEQVVASWGKPSWFWSRCYGGPRFCYGGGVSVIFDSATNSVLSVLWIRHEPPDFPRLGAGLSGSSSVADFVRVLGTPSARDERSATPNYTGSCQLSYNSSAARLQLSFVADELVSLQLDRPSEADRQRK